MRIEGVIEDLKKSKDKADINITAEFDGEKLSCKNDVNGTTGLILMAVAQLMIELAERNAIPVPELLKEFIEVSFFVQKMDDVVKTDLSEQ